MKTSMLTKYFWKPKPKNFDECEIFRGKQNVKNVRYKAFYDMKIFVFPRTFDVIGGVKNGSLYVFFLNFKTNDKTSLGIFFRNDQFLSTFEQ